MPLTRSEEIQEFWDIHNNTMNLLDKNPMGKVVVIKSSCCNEKTFEGLKNYLSIYCYADGKGGRHPILDVRVDEDSGDLYVSKRFEVPNA